LKGPFDAQSIVKNYVVPEDLVVQQLADALLLPVERDAPTEPGKEKSPDDSQLKAATAGPEPRLVRAGPGTGKTRTLVGRVAHLISKGEEPASILALTYSNLSAQDLSLRIRAEVGDPSVAVWSGTFHGYGLELLRKFGSIFGFSKPPKLLDRTDSLMFLEKLLPELHLNHYLNLYEPLLSLRSILGAIGRAKDELMTPADYERLAQRMKDRAEDAESLQAAERAIEVARVYAVYDRSLRSQGLLDFGDLIVRPVEMLRLHEDVRAAVRAERRHILVDEYQDMNRASGFFLKEIVEPGRGPWVVGDVRQAIYRFRGASPVNMSRFAEDFPGAQITDLEINYRSGGKIVRAFEAFGRKMVAAKLAPECDLVADRGETNGKLEYDVAATRESEAEGIAQSIKARVLNGASYGNHTVLARTHTVLSRLARHLERAGVPCLYFGDFFERPEVRDLLALLSLVSEKSGAALLRVGQMPQYAVHPNDIISILEWQSEEKVSAVKALMQIDEIDGVSDRGKSALRRLADDVSHATWPMLPQQFLMGYLFNGSDYVRRLVADESVAGQQRALAVYQLLQFAFAFKPPTGEDPKRAFLKHIRRLEVLDEEKQLRQLPAAARNIDAVKLMTVHASKGLEFPIVHIAALTKSQFPKPSRASEFPPPDGLISADDIMTNEAEEQGLFFVGMSRAQDILHLSRALMNGLQSTKSPSKFLEHVAPHVPKAIESKATWNSTGASDPPFPKLADRKIGANWDWRAFETYVDCPRKFYYDEVLTLKGDDARSPFRKFQDALHATLSWARKTISREERRTGKKAQFEADWAKRGPVGEAHEALYRTIAEKMLDAALDNMEGESLQVEFNLKLPRTGVVVHCRPDHIHSTEKGVVIQRLKAGRLAKKEEKRRYVLWEAAACEDHPNATITFEQISLLDGERRVSNVQRDKVRIALQSFDEVVTAAADGHFDPNPGERCPTCPFYFLCPSTGAVV
jgi:superfamily I DNA/RNA helicase